jgi:hypothetical protein
MSTLDPAVRDLLAAVYSALGAIEAPPSYPLSAAMVTIDEALRWGVEPRQARWLDSETAEAADAKRVRRADVHESLVEQGLVRSQ